MSNMIPNLKETIFSIDNIKQKVLPSYNLKLAEVAMVKFKDTEKQRAVYKVDFNNQSYCLKKVYFSKSDLLYVYSALEWLHRHDLNVPKLLPSINKGRFVTYNNMLFILTPWIEGIKCDFDDINHVISSSLELAKMHKCSDSFVPIPMSSIREGYDDLYISTLNHFEQLLTTSNLAFQHKDKFSKEFLSNFDKNLELAKISLQISSEIDRYELSTSLCHGDYVNKNIIFSPDNKVWLIDFDKCKNDYCSHDISYFLRRLLKRDNTAWNIEIATSVIKAYNSIKPLTTSDLKYIISYICFPQKFWKISRDYYKNIKKCNKNSFLTLLTKSNIRVDYQLEFANNIVYNMNSINWNPNLIK
ncbi:CotS family spore coat protein [Clostridium paraputrificum]|uniref:CotS family spore coat protein n=1 Tax=Clostridium TaxID=1485 RepID=UPI003D3495B6